MTVTRPATYDEAYPEFDPDLEEQLHDLKLEIDAALERGDSETVGILRKKSWALSGSPVPDDDAPPVVGGAVRLVRASSITMERPTWADELWAPVAAVTLAAGRPGLGKTVVIGERAARLTRGQLPGCFFGRATDVIYVGQEDDPAAVLVPRYAAAGADLDRVHFVQVEGGYPFEIASDLLRLDELITSLPEVSLVMIDPLDAHLGQSVDSHRKSEVQSMIGRLGGLAQKHRLAIIGIAHLSKGDTRDLLSRIIGSVAFTSSVRSVIGIGEHPDDPTDRVMVLAKSNLTDKSAVPALRFRVEGAEIPHDDGGTVTTARVVWLGEELGLDPDSIVRVPDADERTERDDAADWIRRALADGPVPYREIERQAGEDGISRATLHRAKKALGVEITRNETERGRPSVWSLGVSLHPQSDPGETKTKPSVRSLDGVDSGVPSQPAPLCDQSPIQLATCGECGLRPATRTSAADRPWCDECWSDALDQTMANLNTNGSTQ